MLPKKPPEIDTILEELSEKGHIVFLKSSRRKSSWVILNKEVLFGDINGTVFAPKHFKQHKNLASSTGVVPFSAIESDFPGHDPNMIVSFLSHLEFCHVIADKEVLDLIGDRPAHSTTGSASLEPYLFFPHLVSIECPQEIWGADDNCEYKYKCGWLLWCSEHFFTPRFLQIILLWLAFSFALETPIRKHKDHPAIHGQCFCSIWKNGISWLNADGIEVVVEMREQNQVVAVMMRCIGRSTTECIHLRSSIIQKILLAKNRFCPEASTTESFIHPHELQYPLSSPQDLTLFSMHDVAKSIVTTKPCVRYSDGGGFKPLELETLLFFEPYADLRINILKELFDEEKKGTEVTNELLKHIANQIVRKTKDIDHKKECFLKLFDPFPESFYKAASKDPIDELVLIFKLWRDRSKDRSYEGLRRKLDEYSVFCGRNPLVRFSHAVFIIFNFVVDQLQMT